MVNNRPKIFEGGNLKVDFKVESVAIIGPLLKLVIEHQFFWHAFILIDILMVIDIHEALSSMDKIICCPRGVIGCLCLIGLRGRIPCIDDRALFDKFQLWLTAA